LKEKEAQAKELKKKKKADDKKIGEQMRKEALKGMSSK